MSGLEVLAVVGCVAAVVSAYRDGGELVRQIKEKRRLRRELHAVTDAPTQELEQSLTRGSCTVEDQYHFMYKRLGKPFAQGDYIAIDALKTITIQLQGQLITNLRLAWREDTYTDFSTLQDVSDSSQDHAVMALLQLHQRILNSAPIQPYPNKALPSPPPSYPMPPTSPGFPPPYPPSSPMRQGTVSTVLEESSGKPTQTMLIGDEKRSSRFGIVRLFPRRPKVDVKELDQMSAQIEDLLSVDSMNPRRDIDEDKLAQFKGPPSSKGAPSIMSFSSMEPDLDYRRESNSEKSRRSSHDTPHNDNQSCRSILNTNDPPGPDNPEWNPWQANNQNSKPAQNPPRNFGMTLHTPGAMSKTSASNMSRNGRQLLPGEDNSYGGFCKGAWRLQIGDRKKAMDERARPQGMSQTSMYWKCSKCEFEGRLTKDEKGRKSCDPRIMRINGIQFRWQFLFKSHVQIKESMRNPIEATFGCMFCCAEGKGTPTFGGAKSLITHLQEHRGRPIGEVVLHRMNTIVGRVARPDEDFDVNLASPPEEDIRASQLLGEQ